MGLFGRKKDKAREKELKEARATMKGLERTKSQKVIHSSTVDPSRAITELQPYQTNNQEKSVNGLSQLTHKDMWGVDIKEPDLTNPTRNRWERPLDTVRAFQESVDRGYRRSYYGGEGESLYMQQSSPPSQAGGHSFVGRNTGPSDVSYNRPPIRPGNGDSTPKSYSSAEEQGAGFGAMGGRNHTNDYNVANPAMSNRARNHSSGGSGSYQDTGYGESMNQGSRGNSSGNLEATGEYGNGSTHQNGGYSNGNGPYANGNGPYANGNGPYANGNGRASPGGNGGYRGNGNGSSNGNGKGAEIFGGNNPWAKAAAPTTPTAPYAAPVRTSSPLQQQHNSASQAPVQPEPVVRDVPIKVAAVPEPEPEPKKKHWLSKKRFSKN